MFVCCPLLSCVCLQRWTLGTLWTLSRPSSGCMVYIAHCVNKSKTPHSSTPTTITPGRQVTAAVTLPLAPPASVSLARSFPTDTLGQQTPPDSDSLATFPTNLATFLATTHSSHLANSSLQLASLAHACSCHLTTRPTPAALAAFTASSHLATQPTRRTRSSPAQRLHLCRVRNRRRAHRITSLARAACARLIQRHNARARGTCSDYGLFQDRQDLDLAFKRKSDRT